MKRNKPTKTRRYLPAILFCASSLWARAASSSKDKEASFSLRAAVAKMASHAIFQYNVLAIDGIHNTWTNMIVKMIILRHLGSSDDKEKIGVARPEGPPLRGFRNHREGLRVRVWHRINRRWVFYTRRCIDLEYTRLGFYTG